MPSNNLPPQTQTPTQFITCPLRLRLRLSLLRQLPEGKCRPENTRLRSKGLEASGAGASDHYPQDHTSVANELEKTKRLEKFHAAPHGLTTNFGTKRLDWPPLLSAYSSKVSRRCVVMTYTEKSCPSQKLHVKR
jgi:hypothetical protein